MRVAHTPGAAKGRAARPAMVVAVLAALLLVIGCGSTATPDALSSPAGRALAALPVEDAGSGADYDRLEQFGDWADPDGNGCDTRNDVLARDLTGVVVADDGCTVRSGTLEDPYTGTTIPFVRGPATSADVQIDHVVALQNAWITGADRLTQDERADLANDPLNLLAVDGPTNGDKSAADAAEWLPPNEAYRCEYVARQIAVKSRYGLFVTAAEKDAMAGVLAGCPDQGLPPASTTGGAAPSTGAPASTDPADPGGGSPVPATEPSSSGGTSYADCAAARAAGAAPLRSGDPGYRPGMDGDRDGVACEG
ncbi:MAG: GmrSD restriction endonuclease domain-containing protein [Actinomycetota bacterium]